MRKILIIGVVTVLSIVLLLFLAFILGTSAVDPEAYFDSDYYHNTRSRLDSIKSAGVPETTGPIQAGFSKVSITPGLNNATEDFVAGKFGNVPLAGFGARDGKPATGIHDSVFVRAAAIEASGQVIVFVSADLLIMPPNIVDTVTQMLSEKGLQREQIYYSATHTHSSVGAWGSGYVGELFAGKEDPRMEQWLAIQTAQAITSAIDNLRPARIAAGNFHMGTFTSNRLIGETGTKNNDFSFIVLEQDGHKKAILGSYSAHATTLGADNWEISADYPGYWARKMEEGTVDYALFLAGSVGSQSPAGEGSGFDKAKYIGEALADSLKKHIQGMVPNDSLTFSALSLRLDLPQYNIRLTAGRNLATSLSKRLLPFSGNAYLQAVRIDDMIWISTPADFSGEYALQLKNSLAPYGYKANVTSFNGNYVGYIVPGRYFYLDEYEPKVMGWFGPNMGEYTMDIMRQISRLMTKADNI